MTTLKNITPADNKQSQEQINAIITTGIQQYTQATNSPWLSTQLLEYLIGTTEDPTEGVLYGSNFQELLQHYNLMELKVTSLEDYTAIYNYWLEPKGIQLSKAKLEKLITDAFLDENTASSLIIYGGDLYITVIATA